MLKKAVLIISIICTGLSLVWYIVEGGYEPIIVMLTGIVPILYTSKDLITIKNRNNKYFPENTIEDLNDQGYQVLNASKEDILWITQKTKELHGSHAVPFKTKLSWYEKNKTGFFIVKDKNGKNVGSIDLFPVKFSVIDDIASGKIHENQKKSRDVISDKNKDQITCLYLENMMALKNGNKPDVLAFKAILKKIPYILRKVCNNGENVKLYTMSAKEFSTSEGVLKSNTNDMLDKFGFTKVTDNTVQNLPLYYSDVKSIIKRVRNMFS